MRSPSHPRRPRPSARRPRSDRGFTLTELLVALAIVALLLVGISRIFGVTSATIGAGQSLSRAVRTQKAVQTSLSADILGYGDLANPQMQSGMLPFVNTLDAAYSLPYLAISNFRVPAYASDRDAASDKISHPMPGDIAPGFSAAAYQAYSAKVRGTDLDNDGSESASELAPLYAYGDRNFRCDTINFFARGDFESKTNPDPTKPAARSTEAWIWYGQGRVYNGAARTRYYSAGYQNPGDPVGSAPTAATVPPPVSVDETANTNNKYADQFKLCRFIGLMVEPSDVKMNLQNLATSTKLDRLGVVANGDLSRPIPFVSRNWLVPADQTSYTSGAYKTTASSLPISFDSQTTTVAIYVPTSATAGALVNVSANGVRSDLAGAAKNSVNAVVNARASMTVTDAFGVGLRQFRDYIGYLAANKFNNSSNWRGNLPSSWADRPWLEPTPKLDATLPQVTPTVMAREQQVLANGCSQFTVEYAGDFVTQDPATGAVILPIGDGVLDYYVTANGVRETRFYGLPRDVDGDGKILTTAAAYQTSPDVLPLRDLRNGVQSPFEYFVPPLPSTANDYLKTTDEIGNDPNDSSYRCVWGPPVVGTQDLLTQNAAGITTARVPDGVPDFYFVNGEQQLVNVAQTMHDTITQNAAGGITVNGPDGIPDFAIVGGQKVAVYDLPQLLRVIVELRDPTAKLTQPLRQQYVFPVRVTGAVSDEKIK